MKNQCDKLDDESLLHKNITTRITQLTGHIATIYIGGITEVEYEEKYDRVDDALRATRSAIEEGIVPGGSYSYLKAANCEELLAMENDKTNIADSIGAKIIKVALLQPFVIMCRNAGIQDIEAFKSQIKIWENGNDGFGFNIKKQTIENLWESGVIDPFKVTRTALQNAASIAGLTLTSNVVIGDLPQVNADSPPQISPPSLF